MKVSFTSTLVSQLLLVITALAVVGLRIVVRLTKLSRRLLLSDYFAIVGCGFLIGMLATSTFASAKGALNMYDNWPDIPPWPKEMLTSLWAYCFFYDIGLYLAKGSLIGLYFNIILPVFRWQRICLYIITGWTVASLIAAACIDIFFCWPVSDEWEDDPNACSAWNSDTTYRINYALNIISDVIIFALPFSLLSHIKTNRQQRLGLIFTFCLGVVTMVIGTMRLLWIMFATWDFGPTVIWSTGEVCASLVVVSLPTFKVLLSDRITSGPSSATPSASARGESSVFPSESARGSRGSRTSLMGWFRRLSSSSRIEKSKEDFRVSHDSGV